MAAVKIYRNELKYYISYPEYLTIRTRLTPFMLRDPFGNRNNLYLVRSLYFDDINNSAYYEKLNGVEKREKYRIRIYNYKKNVIKLEKKGKSGSYTLKESESIPLDLCESILAGNIDSLARSGSELQSGLYIQMKTERLRPVVLVDYIREAYIHPVERVRITFDMRLRSGMYSTDLWNPDISMVSVLDPGSIIMEVKFNRFLPSVIRSLISCTRSERDSISKYVLCRNY